MKRIFILIVLFVVAVNSFAETKRMSDTQYRIKNKNINTIYTVIDKEKAKSFAIDMAVLFGLPTTNIYDASEIDSELAALVKKLKCVFNITGNDCDLWIYNEKYDTYYLLDW